MIKVTPMGRPTPFLPVGGRNAGRLEKRENVFSLLQLNETVSEIGDFNYSVVSNLEIDYDLDVHNNHGSDPTTQTLNFDSSATQVMDKNRSLTSNVSLSDHVHISLDGYHPANELYVTANESIAVGQPLYVSSSNTVNLADADSINTSTAIGLAKTAATANEEVAVLTEGSLVQDDWTSVIGTANLTPSTIYYLDTSSGMMTSSVPSGEGDVIVSLGVAVTNKKFEIEINEVAVL